MAASRGNKQQSSSVAHASAEFCKTAWPLAPARQRGGIAMELIEACAAGDVGRARLLLEAGADANHTHAGGGTALILASIRGHVECAHLLLEAGADLLAADIGGKTAFFYGSTRLAVVQLLCAYGAPRVEDDYWHDMMTDDKRAWLLETCH
mmetsp:Transcript_23344/g.58251  ORF Transcript_23344/g.58251 Transcript_23344/m.58251 type:complete len:151 (+) Transcript_23344:74-526(+)